MLSGDPGPPIAGNLMETHCMENGRALTREEQRDGGS